MSYNIQWSQLKVTLAKTEACQVPPVLSRDPKSDFLFAFTQDAFLQQLICKCTLESPDPLCHLHFILGLSSLQRSGDYHLIACENIMPELHTSLFQLQCPFSPIHSQRKSKDYIPLVWRYPVKKALDLRGVKSWPKARVTTESRRQRPGLEARVHHMLHLANHKGASQVSLRSPFFWIRLHVTWDLLTKRSYELPFSLSLAEICHCK